MTSLHLAKFPYDNDAAIPETQTLFLCAYLTEISARR